MWPIPGDYLEDGNASSRSDTKQRRVITRDYWLKRGQLGQPMMTYIPTCLPQPLRHSRSDYGIPAGEEGRTSKLEIFLDKKSELGRFDVWHVPKEAVVNQPTRREATLLPRMEDWIARRYLSQHIFRRNERSLYAGQTLQQSPATGTTILLTRMARHRITNNCRLESDERDNRQPGFNCHKFVRWSVQAAQRRETE